MACCLYVISVMGSALTTKADVRTPVVYVAHLCIQFLEDCYISHLLVSENEFRFIYAIFDTL